MKRVELLAPAGNYEAFLCAIHAGADAVYLGGEKFSARAYATNFSTDEIIRALQYAHLNGKKIYLTLNTLLKEEEFAQIHDYLKPLVDNGLDGIIVQDIGLMQYVHDHFPSLALHISTQAFVTGAYSAEVFASMGASRVVPARELSLDEIRIIKEKTGLELETFIHGAMCYSYSGQCLFSSIVGERSGNRGKCAGPCRLPYSFEIEGKRVSDKEDYLLSLKDMCTVYRIGELIDAGIDSFKIEGRMKKPEYVAGVTAIYRKVIDAYYQNPEKGVQISKEDERILHSLYIRSELQEGYYFKQNGKDMVSRKSPAYCPNDEKLLSCIREKYLRPEKKIPVRGKLTCAEGKPLTFILNALGKEVCSKGIVVEHAKQRCVTKDELQKSISKFGNTFFELEQIDICLEGECFVPVSALNELRRNASEMLLHSCIDANSNQAFPNMVEIEKTCNHFVSNEWSIQVRTKEQLQAVLKNCKDREINLILESELFLELTTQEWENILGFSCISGVILPYVMRKKDEPIIIRILDKASMLSVPLLYVRNMESFGFVKKYGKYNGAIASDSGLYMFQSEAFKKMESLFEKVTLPIELNQYEKKELLKKIGTIINYNVETMVYGKIPMMISANCLFKTTVHCLKNEKEKGRCQLIDRMNHSFDVISNCMFCYNVIYNCLPLSLHKTLPLYKECGKRIIFTTETPFDIQQILRLFLMNDGTVSFEFTNGHEKRGV